MGPLSLSLPNEEKVIMTLGRIIKRELFSHEDITGDPAEQDLYLLRTLLSWKSSPIESGKHFFAYNFTLN